MTTALNISSPKVLKNAGGTVLTVSVIAPGSGPGTIYEAATIGAAAAENQIASVPAAVGVYRIDFPCSTGIVVAPSPGQVPAVSFS
jgi:hypothetical protein